MKIDSKIQKLTSPEASFINENSHPFHLYFDKDKPALTHTIIIGKAGNGMTCSPVQKTTV